MRRQLQHGTLLAINFIYRIGSGQYRHNGTFHTERRLDDMRHERRATVLWPILHALAACPLDILQVEVCTIRQAQQLFAADRVVVLEVYSALTVMRTISFRYFQ